jgi:hypothetical protein
VLLLVFLLVNILAILSSFVLPIFRLFGQNGPTWAFMVSYFLEMALWIGCIAIYGGMSGFDWTFLLLCGITMLRSSQYEYLGPCEPLNRTKIGFSFLGLWSRVRARCALTSKRVELLRMKKNQELLKFNERLNQLILAQG